MFRKLTALLTLIMIAGCETFAVNNKVYKTEVYWHPVENVKQVCDHLFDSYGIKRVFLVQGCAIWNKDHSKCVIITSNNTDTHILGHELRHCFEGQFHN